MGINFNSFLKEELPVNDIQTAMKQGDITSKELTMYYLHRIAKYDQGGQKINSMLEINPEALDEERLTKGARGPLHGIPCGFKKDNIETKDFMPIEYTYVVTKMNAHNR